MSEVYFQGYKRWTMIIIGGYRFQKRSQYNDKTYFKCAFDNCKGTAQIIGSLEIAAKAILTRNHDDHSNIESLIAKTAKNTRDLILDQIRLEVLKSPAINSNELTEHLANGFQELLPNYDKDLIKKDIKVIRNELGLNYGSSAAEKLSSLIEHNIQFLRGFGQYLIKNTTHRYIIGCTEGQLANLRESNHGYVHATFGVLPKDFHQLLIIASIEPLTQKTIPLCFIAMSDKKEYLYEKIFREIKFLLGQNEFSIKLTHVTIDFERAISKAIKSVFNIKVIGCYFHYSKSLHAKAKSMGLLSKKNLKLKEETGEIMNELKSISWNSNKSVEAIKQKHNNVVYVKFFQYFNKVGVALLEDHVITYNDIPDQRFRSNSVLESINAKIKQYFPVKSKNIGTTSIERLKHIYLDYYNDIIHSSLQGLTTHSKFKQSFNEMDPPK